MQVDTFLHLRPQRPREKVIFRQLPRDRETGCPLESVRLIGFHGKRAGGVEHVLSVKKNEARIFSMG